METGRKFWFGVGAALVLTGTYILTLIRAPEQADWKTFAIVFASVTGGYFGANELTKLIVSKFYRPELDKKNGGA